MTKVITNKDNYNTKKYKPTWSPPKNEIKKILRSIKNIFSGKNIKVLIKWDSPKIMTKYNKKQFEKINESFIRKKYKNKGRTIELFIIKKYNLI
jgi:hypothetical protein|tara:strand:+ start:941 stop:1222 length:282 start_codon:yes stop_codon:yes gene_type:complete